MPAQQPITLAEARKKKQQLAHDAEEAEKNRTAEPLPEAKNTTATDINVATTTQNQPAQPTTLTNPQPSNPHQQEEEEEELLAQYQEEDEEEDHDQKAAREAREKIQGKEKKTPAQKKKEYPSIQKRAKARKVEGKKGVARPCKRCKTPHTFADSRSKYCPKCAKIIAAEAAMEGGHMHGLVQKEVEEKLRPFLRIGLNLKESCLEAELVYSTIVEKKKEWNGFSDFIERHMNYPIIKAKRNIFAINSDAQKWGVKETAKTSRWLLERRRPNEFGPKVQLEGTVLTAQLDENKQAIMNALLAHTI